MKVILKPIFEWLTGNYSIFENSFYNYAIMVIIGMISVKVAWNFVGMLYKEDLISGRTIGSIIYWTVNFLVFTVVFFCFSFVIRVVKFIISIPIWCWVTVFVFLIGIVLYRMINRQRMEN